LVYRWIPIIGIGAAPLMCGRKRQCIHDEYKERACEMRACEMRARAILALKGRITKGRGYGTDGASGLRAPEFFF